MKYRATISFTGVVSMAMGDVRELASPVADGLLKAGYIVPLEKKTEETETEKEVKAEKKKAPKRKESKDGN